MRILLITLSIFLFSSCQSPTDDGHKKLASHDKAKASVHEPQQKDSIDEKHEIIKFQSQYRFETFRKKVYTGKLAAPDFTNNPFAKDTEYVNFIRKGCQDNDINFNGHFTVITRFCGALCSSIFIVDRINGRVFTDIGISEGKYGYAYEKDSNLLIANASVFTDSSYQYYNPFFAKPELYVWSKKAFIPIQK